MITDQDTRETAIQPSQSFIVQAPAGSGKTELLTQRFLRLLSCVKMPEEIIAITFTRKAAAEMQQRIISALHQAESTQPPITPHKKLTWSLAKKALAKNRRHHWKILKNPNRLRIFTIDALAAYLAKHTPCVLEWSAQATLTENPFVYYEEAVQQILLTYPVEPLLLHLDNRVDLLENLLIQVLSKRDQWLPHIMGHQKAIQALREPMELALKNIVLELLIDVNQQATEEIKSKLIPLAQFSGKYHSIHDPHHPIAHCQHLSHLNASLENLPAWLGISHLLLTTKGEWRKTVTKKQGFTKDCSFKRSMIELLIALKEEKQFKVALNAIKCSPPLVYQDSQWTLIETLMQLLPLLVAQLNILFARDNVIDFVELNLSALRALGDDHHPTDLTLYLDYHISHLLIDEFQDTSVTQFQLIERLIAGWEKDDERTLFLVGDPMQSIYRFRQAEVGLFLQAQKKGIGHKKLTPLTLKENFRCSQAIVKWANQNFQTIFPSETDIQSGGVSYSASHTRNNTIGEVKWHRAMNDEGHKETEQIIGQIKEIQLKHPEDSIAILLRYRRQAPRLIQCLHQANLSFEGIDLEPLAERIEIQDIHSLTRALLHRHDRIAWLSILRAPYCGLKLSDLTILAEAAHTKSIWTVLKSYQTLNTLSQDAILRLEYCVPPLYEAIANKHRHPLHLLLRILWKELRAEKTLRSINQQKNIESYLQLIEALEKNNPILSLPQINQFLRMKYTENLPTDNGIHLQMMTIHKAKGLEFDHVLLPGLHLRPSREKTQILKWLERPNLSGKVDLIFAPIKSSNEDSDALYAYLQRIDSIKAQHESQRLLYVATTRARKTLHLFANVKEKQGVLRPAEKDSFLHYLWNTDASSFDHQTIKQNTTETKHLTIEKTNLRRLTKSYLESQKKPIMPFFSYGAPPLLALKNITPRQVGILIHEALEQIAKTGRTNSKHWHIRLKELGVPAAQLNNALNTVQGAIKKTQQDPRGRWILSNKHQDAQAEYALTFFDDQILHSMVIDRCFIENGIRWIIDYKTDRAFHDPEPLKKHDSQLKLYAQAFQAQESLPIHTALYYPISSQWVEINVLKH